LLGTPSGMELVQSVQQVPKCQIRQIAPVKMDVKSGGMCQNRRGASGTHLDILTPTGHPPPEELDILTLCAQLHEEWLLHARLGDERSHITYAGTRDATSGTWDGGGGAARPRRHPRKYSLPLCLVRRRNAAGRSAVAHDNADGSKKPPRTTVSGIHRETTVARHPPVRLRCECATRRDGGAWISSKTSKARTLESTAGALPRTVEALDRCQEGSWTDGGGTSLLLWRGCAQGQCGCLLAQAGVER